MTRHVYSSISVLFLLALLVIFVSPASAAPPATYALHGMQWGASIQDVDKTIRASYEVLKHEELDNPQVPGCRLVRYVAQDKDDDDPKYKSLFACNFSKNELISVAVFTIATDDDRAHADVVSCLISNFTNYSKKYGDPPHDVCEYDRREFSTLPAALRAGEAVVQAEWARAKDGSLLQISIMADKSPAYLEFWFFGRPGELSRGTSFRK